MIHEPMTLATDYLLAVVSGVAGVLAFRFRAGQGSRGAWSAAFFALALAAALGGTHHGFAIQALWKPTVFVAGLASFCMLAGSTYATTRGAVRHALLGFAWLKFVLFAMWTSGNDRFIWVVIDSGIAFVLVALLHGFKRDAAAGGILCGVALSLAAGAAQASGFDLHRHFNHNDLYHVIQIAALVAFYRGVRRMTDR